MNRRQALTLVLLPLAASFGRAADYPTAEEARRAFFPGATSFDAHPVRLTPEQRREITSVSGVKQRGEEQPVWRAMKDATPLGWFLVDDVVGKHEYITYALAISPEGAVIGVEILAYRETHGAQVGRAEWRACFKGRTLADPLQLDRDIPNISGATLSCRNVTNGVKRLLALHRVALPHA